MKYVDEFRSKKLIDKVAGRIKEVAPADAVNIMEVCGTHTHNFRRFGLNKMLPSNARLIAGPGCPVCVSPQEYIDAAIKLASDKGVIIATFGDLLRVPGANSSLEKERAKDAVVRVVYSPLGSLQIARRNPDKKVIFLGVGFETTAPAIALSIISAKKEKIENLYFFVSLKTIIPAMKYLLQDTRLNIKGFLCPGHVSAIIGARPYEFIPKKYKIPCVICGFEPLDILEGLYIILKQVKYGRPRVSNQYARVVRQQGNTRAQEIISEVFKVTDSSWRGFGNIADSGLEIRRKYSDFDAGKQFHLSLRHPVSSPQPQKCKCGDVLKGLILPKECPLFSKGCSPDNPIGPCMVSSEGACNAYYRYR